MTPTVGRIVHFLVERRGEIEARPAMIVKVWSEDCVQLQVFLDGGNDAAVKDGGGGFAADECDRGLAWRTSVPEGTEIGQWSWPPRV